MNPPDATESQHGGAGNTVRSGREAQLKSEDSQDFGFKARDKRRRGREPVTCRTT